ncbi:hypothetical protein RCH14_002254 [Massilia sp. MP_M2]|uniref:hypothetical protein n=1 Tax=Massilia sp. MP_M2 TaxID=3071713 RepID=UPI00319EB960
MNAAIETIVTTPYAQLRIAAVDVGDHALMRARQLANLLVLIQPKDGPDDTLWLAQQMADEVVATVAGMMGVKA